MPEYEAWQGRVTALPPEKRLEGLSPTERLKGLSPDERRAVLEELRREFDHPPERN